MVSIPCMSSVSPRIGPRHSVDPAYIPSPMATRPPSSGSIAATGCTTRWIAAPSLASTMLWLTSDWPATLRCDKYYTTTSLGQPPQPWPATTGLLTMCLTVSLFRAGHGTDFRSDRQNDSLRQRTNGSCSQVGRGAARGPAGRSGRGVGAGPGQGLALHPQPARAV